MAILALGSKFQCELMGWIAMGFQTYGCEAHADVTHKALGLDGLDVPVDTWQQPGQASAEVFQLPFSTSTLLVTRMTWFLEVQGTEPTEPSSC